MSVSDDTGDDPAWFETAEEAPAYDLTFAYDDPEDPATVTIYPESATDRTTWLSVDADHAVSLADAR
ncbi:hypothetical protein GJ629_12365 [Halapricum sp. CBA1109]|uniref:DUF7511 domain-containing protein n=1 Tax=Halapricum sp. CBA1109 TaxID=2668068 RepID=UPI0012F77FA0|nr:hypothetical protein [Halapricum sp. CBA1109]MUV90596.1 hypothetical protein [Halapricum sp. CBA1109]